MLRLSGTITLGPLRLPVVVAALIGATVAASTLAALAGHGGIGVGYAGVLVATEVWRGQVWRLVTWVLFESEPLPLVLGCLTLYWFGGDMVAAWGPRRFLGFYFGLTAAAGVVTCLVGLVWTIVGVIPASGCWPVLDALVIAWGLLHPRREIRLWGVLRLLGRHLVWATVGGTVLYAVFYGAALFVPHFAAELLVLAWFGPIRRLVAARSQAVLAERKNWTFDKWMDGERRR